MTAPVQNKRRYGKAVAPVGGIESAVVGVAVPELAVLVVAPALDVARSEVDSVVGTGDVVVPTVVELVPGTSLSAATVVAAEDVASLPPSCVLAMDLSFVHPRNESSTTRARVS